MSTLTITLIQTALHWENPAANLEMFTEKINSIQEKTELVILPEMFTTGFSMKPEKFAEEMNGDTILWMRKMATDKKIILTGSIMVKENNHFYNRLIWMLPNGEMGFYDKRHLFAYADEHNHYQHGNKRFIASVKGWRVNLLICYDLRFPVWSRQSASNKLNYEFDVLVYVANWPERRSHAWKTLLQARAIENQCYCIGVNRIGKDGNGIQYNGESMVISPLGEIIYQKADVEDIGTITLQKEELEKIREKMPFLQDADLFQLLN